MASIKQRFQPWLYSAKLPIMDKKCLACEHLKEPKFQILRTDHWNVVLDNNQAYFGRAYLTLLTHKGSLGSLDETEWQEFEEIVRKLEKAYKEVFGAEPLNWGCFMNNAFRSKPFNPHVSWHIYPRYEKAPELDDIIFDDALFGEFYDDNAKRIVSDETVKHIEVKLTDYLAAL